MYQHNKRQNKKSTFALIILVPIILIIIFVISFIVIDRDSFESITINKKSSSVEYSGQKNQYENDIFSISLPNNWAFVGRKNPAANALFYEFQDQTPKQDNRYFRVYIDKILENYPLKQIITVEANYDKLLVGAMSEGCQDFTKGSPNSEVTTVWNNISFMCTLNPLNTDIGSINKGGGYAIKVNGKSGQSHNYFFMYRDLNIHPRPENLSDILRSFIAK